MSIKNYAAQIVFGAKQDSSVGSTIGRLRSEITSIGTTIAAQRRSLADIGGLRAGQTRVSQAQEWLRGEQMRLQSVRREGSSRDIRQAEQGVRRATTELTRQRTALIALGAAARAAGVDTSRLAEEERRLGDSIAALGTRQAGLTETHAAHQRLGESIANLRMRFGAAGAAFVNDSKRMAVGIGGIAAAAGVASLAIGGLVKSVVDDADNVADTADALGITTAALQTWQYAASTVGVDAEKLGASFAKYQKGIEEGSDKTLKVLGELGISHASLAQQPLGRQLLIISEALKNYKGSMSEAAIVQTLMGKGAYKLTTVMKTGVEGLNKLHLQGVAAGSVLTKEQLGVVDEAASAFDYLGATAKGLKNSLGIALAPAVSELATAFTDLISGNRGQITEWARQLGETIRKDLVPQVQVLITDFPRVTKAIGETASKIWSGITAVKNFVGGWDNLGIALLALNFAPTIASLGSLLLSLGPVGLAVGALAAGVVLLGENQDMVLGKVTDFTKTVSGALEGLGTTMKGALDPAFRWIGEQFDWMASKLDGIRALGGKIRDAFTPVNTTGTASLQPSEVSTDGMAQLMPQGTLQSTISGRAPQTNNFNITVPAVQDGTDFAGKFRDSLKQKPLFDEFGVLAPN
jgi:hypothetical protein